MAKEIDKSLGDEKTRAGKDRAGDGEDTAKSIGDSQTNLGDLGSELAGLEEELELVDLSARYEVEGTIGQGGMGEVLLATDRRLKRKVAIKRIRGELARNKAALGRFLSEARAVAALAHNNIVQLYDYGRDAQGPFMVMEYVDGGSLLEKCGSGPLPLEEAVELTCQLCDGLAVAHEAGIVHRDIKPANILLTKSGTPKLTDFGLAKAELGDASLTMAGAVLGTLDFMPPEQRRDAALTDARSDLWSLAAMLYQMITGESPKVIRLKKVPLELQDLLDKGLEESKENRFQSVREFKQALQEATKRSKPAAPQRAAVLVAGECPACHAGNESDWKFCRECAEPLRCKCLKCQYEIPVWDKICRECGGKQAELATELLQTIEIHVQNHDRESLLPLVQRALSLLGDRQDARKLLDQVAEQQIRERDDAFQRADRLLSEGSAVEALRTVKPVSFKRLTLVQSELLAKLEEICAAEGELSEMVQQAEAAGVIDAAEIVALLPKAIAYIGLNPSNQKFLKLKDDLLARAGGVPVELLRSLPPEAIAQLSPRIRESMNVLINSIGMRLKLLKAGTFTMGDSQFKDAIPHQVTLTRPFYLGVYEVTQEQYQRVMGKNPSRFKGARNPVEQVSWEDAVEFCRKLSALPEEQAAGRVYRLPTEAEWEYACRAGSTTRYSFGDNDSQLGDHAWFGQNSDRKTHPVGEKQPNGWGLYDMHGNVWEWCNDWYGDYPKGAVSDPVGPSGGSNRVRRGGSWRDVAAGCRSAGRDGRDPSFRHSDRGFRVALSFPGIPK